MAQTPARASILCPVDFSEPSRLALGYAAAVAEHLEARLLVLSVEDPLLAAAAHTAGLQDLPQQTEEELRRFVASAWPDAAPPVVTIEVAVTVGKPAGEIVRFAQANACALIVVSSHGRSGLAKTLLGSTTERVLRDTPVPVLITPQNARPVANASDISGHVHRIVAPVDLTDATPGQLAVAGEIATRLGVPLLLAHVLEPIYVPPRVRLAIPTLEDDRRHAAEQKLLEQRAACGSSAAVETLVVAGSVPEEIAAVAEARQAGLIVMGLHSSGRLGRRMGSVTYRVLCLTRALVLALPPAHDGPPRSTLADTVTSASAAS
jgi:nucleotide-binding universal stress UspA family protein